MAGDAACSSNKGSNDEIAWFISLVPSRDVHGRQTMIDLNHLNHYPSGIHVLDPAT